MLSAKSDVQVDTPGGPRHRVAAGAGQRHRTSHSRDGLRHRSREPRAKMTIVAPGGERSKAQLGLGKSYFRKAGVEHDVLNETARRESCSSK